MNLLPFGELPPYRERAFVPPVVNWDNWVEIEVLFDRLEDNLAISSTVEALEQWLLDWGELSAALDEYSTRLYIAMTCHTDNEDAEKAYLNYVENIAPRLKPRQFRLETLYLEHDLRPELDPIRYGVFDRDIEVSVSIYRDENVPLETEVDKLDQQYQKLTGSLTVQFRGEEYTLTQMGKFLEEPDRPLREEVWRLVSNRRLEEKEQFEDIFDRQVALRHKIAQNAGFSNFMDYAFKAKGRFDYTPADCVQFHNAVEAEVMPLVRQIQADRRRDMELESLRPWDTAADPLGRPPLRPFEQVDSMVGGCQKIFERLDGELADGFRMMQELRLLDLDNRKGKAPGGYQSSLAEARLPFIFMNAVGVQRDVETLLHECGHAFHAIATRNEDLYYYRHAPLEFCEVASMSMELLGGEHLEVFYGPEELKRARKTHLEGIITLFPWVATVDAFQYWIYTHKNHTREERTAAWVELMQRFGGDVDWTGFEEVRANLWHRQLHIFLSPFYYIEYGIAQLGALQVWKNSKEDLVGALGAYKSALALGHSRPLPQLFTAAGCRFSFDAATIRPLMELAKRELEALAD